MVSEWLTSPVLIFLLYWHERLQLSRFIADVQCAPYVCRASRHASPLCVPQERHPGDSKNYNECIRHETMRVAVCDMLEGKIACPEALW